MYPMQGPSGEDEYSPPESLGQNLEGAKEVFDRIVVVGYGLFVAYKVFKQDEVRLQVLHTTIRICQKVASLFGRWAIRTENNYNEITETLH